MRKIHLILLLIQLFVQKNLDIDLLNYSILKIKSNECLFFIYTKIILLLEIDIHYDQLRL